MFAYNPGVNDQSGQIIAQGAQNAAQVNAQMLSDFGQSIGSMLNTFGEAYKQKEQDKSDARIYGNLLKVIAPAFGQNGDAILQEYNANKNDRDKANYGRTMVGSLGAISNMMMAQRNAGIREQGQQISRDRPFIDASLKSLSNTAAGNVPHGGGTAPVEPPLPPMSQAGPVDQAPGATSPQAPSMPGGQASRDLLNRDRARRGLAPI